MEPLHDATVTTRDELDALLKKEGDNVVILKFSAEWCVPCREIAPAFLHLVQEMEGVTAADADADSSQELFEEFDIKGMPTFLFFKNASLEARLRKGTIDEIHTELKRLLPTPKLVLDADF
eukprot:2344067-Prymnesium_polylepis.1